MITTNFQRTLHSGLLNNCMHTENTAPYHHPRPPIPFPRSLTPFLFDLDMNLYQIGYFLDHRVRALRPKRVLMAAVIQATGLDAWASRVKCPARFVSHLHEICIYIWVVYSLCFFCCLFCNLMVCVVYWVGKWQSRGSTGMFGNLTAIYHIMLQFIQNHSRFVMLMIWK